jgi:hypothetical protein
LRTPQIANCSVTGVRTSHLPAAKRERESATKEGERDYKNDTGMKSKT